MISSICILLSLFPPRGDSHHASPLYNYLPTSPFNLPCFIACPPCGCESLFARAPRRYLRWPGRPNSALACAGRMVFEKNVRLAQARRPRRDPDVARGSSWAASGCPGCENGAPAQASGAPGCDLACHHRAQHARFAAIGAAPFFWRANAARHTGKSILRRCLLLSPKTA